MPRRDGTGPVGMGSMTGRGFGPCTTSKVVRAGASLGLGLGLGLARRFAGRRNFAQNTAVDQKELLAQQKELLQARLDSIDEQLNNL